MHQSPPTPDSSRDQGAAPSATRFRSSDWILFLLAFAAVFAWRARGFDRTGLVHYDEGVYAVTAEAVRTGRGSAEFHPQQALHAPPLHPWCSGTLARIAGIPAAEALRVWSLATGAAAVALLLFGVRRSAGRAAAATGAFLAASDESLALWSRSGMTDAFFSAALVFAALTYAAAEKRRSLALALLFGLAAGVASNVKYVGWLVVVAAAIGAAPRFANASREDRRGMVIRLAAATVVALLCKLPYALSLAGTATDASAIAGQHDRFIDAAHWWRSFVAQCGYHALDAGVFARAAAVLVVFAASCLPRLRRRVAEDPFLATATAAALLWFLLVPVYHPYPRLMVPLLTFAYATTGGVIGLLGPKMRTTAMLVALSLGSLGAATAVKGREPSDGLARAAADIAQRIPAGRRTAVLAEPVVSAYLRDRGIAAELLGHPWQIADDPSAEAWIVSGRYVRRNGEWEAWEAARLRSAPVVFFTEAAVNDVRRLDDFLPSDARGGAASDPTTYGLELRRVSPR